MLTRIIKVITEDRNINQLQENLIKTLNPLINNPEVDGIILQDVSLVTGDNVINHKLGRKLLGWFLVRKRGAAEIYDTQDDNPRPELTLFLNSSANVSCNLYVF